MHKTCYRLTILIVMLIVDQTRFFKTLLCRLTFLRVMKLSGNMRHKHGNGNVNYLPAIK